MSGSQKALTPPLLLPGCCTSNASTLHQVANASSPAIAILHVALNPITGVWSLMRELAKAQSRSGRYLDVGIGVISDSTWPEVCRGELEQCGLTTFLAQTPKVFGTAQFLWQRIGRPPVERWVDDIVTCSGAERCIVHFHNAWLSGIFLPLRPSRYGETRTVATFHGVNGHFRGQPVRRRIHQWIAARLAHHGAAVTSVDRANLQRAEKLLSLNPNRFTVVPNGVTDTSVRACPRLRGAEVFTVGHIGGIVPAKGWRLVVEAARRLRESGVPIKVLLAGSGEEAEDAREVAMTSGGWAQYDGYVANPRERVMNRVDALALMSEQEGLPMAIIEAFSIGLPVIATRVGGVPEIVMDDENGILVERSVEALVGALRRLAGDSVKLAELSSNARSIFETRFEISKVVSRYDDVYRNEKLL